LRGIEGLGAVERGAGGGSAGGEVLPLVEGAEGKHEEREGDTHDAGRGRGAEEPAEVRGKLRRGKRRVDRIGGGRGAADEETGNAAVAELPDGAIEDEVVQIHQRHEDHETLHEVVAKEAARDPWAGDEEREATHDENRIVALEAKRRRAVGCIAARVVARDPEVLRAVHEGQCTGAEIARGQIEATPGAEQGRSDKPQELRERQRGGTGERAEVPAAGEPHVRATGGGDKREGERELEWAGDSGRNAKREEVRVGGIARGVQREEPHAVGEGIAG
jgi:hypothetical protein